MTAPRSKKVTSSVSPEAKARILEGAAAAFGKLGYANVRVEDINVAAGSSRPTFYKVYASKDDVFQALSERHHREIRRRIQAAVAAAVDAPTQLAAMIDAFLRWRSGLGPVGRVLDLEARTPGTSIAHHRKATLRALTKLAAERMSVAGRAPVDPLMFSALISALESVADAQFHDTDESPAALVRANHIGLRIVGAALAQPGDPVPPIPTPPSD
jgi:AcrR family transcriptional regulator